MSAEKLPYPYDVLGDPRVGVSISPKVKEHGHPMTDEELVVRISQLKILQERTAKQIADCEQTLAKRESTP